MNINGEWVGTYKAFKLISGQVPVLQRQIHGQRRLPPLEGGNHGVVLLDGEAHAITVGLWWSVKVWLIRV